MKREKQKLSDVHMTMESAQDSSGLKQLHLEAQKPLFQDRIMSHLQDNIVYLTDFQEFPCL